MLRTTSAALISIAPWSSSIQLDSRLVVVVCRLRGLVRLRLETAKQRDLNLDDLNNETQSTALVGLECPKPSPTNSSIPLQERVLL